MVEENFLPLFSHQYRYTGPYVLQMDETPCKIRIEYDYSSDTVIGAALGYQNFESHEQLIQYLKSLGNLSKQPKSSFWGSLSCLSMEKSSTAPVFCIPSPLVAGVTSDFLVQFLKDILAKAKLGNCKIACFSTDGDSRWRAFAKRNLRKETVSPNDNFVSINHPDSHYVALKSGGATQIMINDCEHILKVLRNQILNKFLVIGPCQINMVYIEEVRVNPNVNGLHKLSVTDTNVQVKLSCHFNHWVFSVTIMVRTVFTQIIM